MKTEKYFCASYTIEASFIFPMIIAVMIAILFLGFYIHDYAILNITAYEMACYGAENLETEEQIEQYGKNILEERLFSTELIKTDIFIASEKENKKENKTENKRKNKKIEVVLNGKFKNPIFPEKLLELTQKEEIIVKKSASIPSASESIRQVHIIIEKMKGLWEEK